MGVTSLQIIFDNPTAVFMPGQALTGRVLVATSSTVKIRGKWFIRRVDIQYIFHV